MDSGKQEFELEWEGIKVKVSYCPDYIRAFRDISGYRLAHLEVESNGRERLPMTGTGYRSHYTSVEDVEAYGSPVDYVRAWLDEAAKSREWQAFQKERLKQRQLSLF